MNSYVVTACDRSGNERQNCPRSPHIFAKLCPHLHTTLAAGRARSKPWRSASERSWRESSLARARVHTSMMPVLPNESITGGGWLLPSAVGRWLSHTMNAVSTCWPPSSSLQWTGCLFSTTISRARALATEKTLARVCREAKATERTNVKLRDMNVEEISALHERAIEVPMGWQLLLQWHGSWCANARGRCRHILRTAPPNQSVTTLGCPQ